MLVISCQDSFYVSPGHENLVALMPELTNTTERALKMTQEDRDCYQVILAGIWFPKLGTERRVQVQHEKLPILVCPH